MVEHFSFISLRVLELHGADNYTWCAGTWPCMVHCNMARKGLTFGAEAKLPLRTLTLIRGPDSHASPWVVIQCSAEAPPEGSRWCRVYLHCCQPGEGAEGFWAPACACPVQAVKHVKNNPADHRISFSLSAFLSLLVSLPVKTKIKFND